MASISYHTALMAAQRLGHLTFSSVLPLKTQAEKFRYLVLPSELLLVIVIGDHRAKPCTSGKPVTCAHALSQEPVTRCHLTSEDLSLVLCSQSSSVAAQTDVMAENSMQDWRGGVLYKHEDLNLISITHIEKNRCHGTSLQSQCWGGRDPWGSRGS